jgi:hypothetical protein
MIGARQHLSDDQLIEVCLSPEPSRAERQHLQRCERCEARRAHLEEMLADVAQVTTAEADAVFTPDRLARQRSRILHRLELDGRPARVIAFPALRSQEPWVSRTRPGMRWIAGAAAAGLVIGLLAGRFVQQLPRTSGGSAESAVQETPGRSSQGPVLQAVSSTLSDDEFLGQIEMALVSPGSKALRTLDELTPRAWEASDSD